MTPLYIAVATVCFQLVPLQYRNLHAEQVVYPKCCTMECFQKVTRTSTEPITAVEGETVYKVYPATATVCDIVGHHEWEPSRVVYGVNPAVMLYFCHVCGVVNNTQNK